MNIRSLGLLALLAFAPLAQAQAPAPTTFVEKEPTRAMIEQLRHGGFVLYMRHGNTDNSRPDQIDLDLNDCSTQRVLNDEGRDVVREVGKAMRAARIPLGEILVSPLCRAKESALLAFGPNFTVNDTLMYTSNLTSEQKKPIVATTRRLLAAPVAAGSNRLIVAHAPNLADTMNYFPKTEGTVIIFVPRGDHFDYIASIKPKMWPGLLR